MVGATHEYLLSLNPTTFRSPTYTRDALKVVLNAMESSIYNRGLHIHSEGLRCQEGHISHVDCSPHGQ